MSRDAPRVYRDPVAVERLERIAGQIPLDARVEVRLDDGSYLRGMVCMRPSVQTFYGPNGDEGMNGMVRIESESLGSTMQAGPTAGSRYLWLDQIGSVTTLPNQAPPEASTRYPVDPNAPTV